MAFISASKFLFSVVLFFFTATAVYTASASEKSEELKRKIDIKTQQIKDIEREIAEYQELVGEESQKARTLGNQITSLNTTVRKLNTDINLTERKIENAELVIEKLGLAIGEAKLKVGDRKSAIAEIIRSINEMESLSLVEILLASSGISEFFGDLENIENLKRKVEANLKELQDLKQNLESQEEEQKLQKNNLETLKVNLNDRQIITKNVQNEKKELLSETKSKEANYQKLLTAREKERAEIDEEIRKIEDELRKLIDPSILPTPRPGVLGWPLETLVVTQGFGLTSFAKNNDSYGSGGHNGVDFRAPIGTPVYAAEEGTIKAIGNSDKMCPGGSYGQWIVIDHPNNLTTLYTHLSLIKTVTGANVSKGSLIGYSGVSGYVTGPHLHFTVYASKTVEIRPSRVCGLLPYGGYLDPLDYLSI